MPYKPQKPCAYPGCPNLSDDRYCSEHRSLKNRQYNRYERRERTKNSYGAQWRKIRSEFFAEHPYCEVCRRKGLLVEAGVVHHIVELAKGGTHDESNLVSLCRSCHSKLHHALKKG